MEALTRVPLSQQAAQALLDEIRNGRWEVGDQIPGELALAAELNVGRSTIREAIRQLAARGVLSSRQGIGVFVSSTTGIDGWNRLAEISAITELVQVRVAIESRAAALAAACHHRDDAARIRRALVVRNGLVTAAPAELAGADIRFHREVVQAAHNSLLLALFDSLQPRLVEAMTELLELMPATQQDADAHAALVEVILAGDSHRAEALARDHLLGVANELESLP
ncbi:FadR family transcriptional regulator [Skermania sp. ID1734]|uniref:FadR/GntR family transcriptional regulator n=1 Tax=Skermania sp. ID1734 TaxID=2597516 RepID=UPI0011807F27|nr:GntR family transcriptional regulator [Skermania sp. ID1734]TSD95330.1 FadR family transcriptional regulator [Skermania sp. ID1734]